MKTKDQRSNNTNKTSNLPERPPPNRIRYVNWNEFLADKNETEKAIKLFWWCERTDLWAWFNFKKAFKSIKDVIYHHLGHHLSLPYKEQVEFSEKIIPFNDIFHLEFQHILAGFGEFEQMVVERFEDRTENSLDKDILDDWGKVKEIAEKHPELETILIEITSEHIDKLGHTDVPHYYKKLNEKNIEKIPLRDKIFLFDEFIHLEHQTESFVTGQTGKTISKIREEFEEKYI